MTIRVRLFARAKEVVGANVVEVSLAPGSTVADFRHQLGQEFPTLASILARSAIAVNDEYAQDSLIVPANADAAIIPPVSGG